MKRVSLVAILLLMILVSIVYSKKVNYGRVKVSRIVSVYDGDTFKCDINDWPDIVGKSIGIRINGIDTPEMKGTHGELKSLALTAKAMTYTILTDSNEVYLENIQRGKYFRIVADVNCDGQDLATTLIQLNLAKPYDGGTKDPWDVNDIIIAKAAERNNCLGDDYLLLSAIRKAENGGPGKEFGVKHPRAWDTNLDTQAGWCASSIVKARKRWLTAGKPEDFITFMGRRYCPPNDHPLNKNWVKNVKYWFKKLQE